MEPYTEREIRSTGLRHRGDWSLKSYSIRCGPDPMDWDGFERALAMAEASLPEVDLAEGRPGLGVLISHQGRTADYVVLAWWNHENELPLDLWVRHERDEPWREAVRGESVCVWDLEVLCEERQAWIATMLGEAGPDADAYLERIPARFKGD